MTTVDTDRHIDLTSLPFPAVQRWYGNEGQVQADGHTATEIADAVAAARDERTRQPSDPVRISGGSDVLIEGRDFRNIAGQAILVSTCDRVTVRDCWFDRVGAAVIAANCTDVTVEHNRCGVIVGPDDVGYSGNFVQFDKVNGGRVVHNAVDTTGAGRDTKDVISIYQSHGTADVPLLVGWNFLHGGGPSGASSGIMLGDSGGSWQTAAGNIVVNTGAVGVGIAGGEHITATWNTVYGQPRPEANVGMYAWNQSSAPCSDIEMSHNRVWWQRSDGTKNSLWDGGNVGPIAGWLTNTWDAPVGHLVKMLQPAVR